MSTRARPRTPDRRTRPRPDPDAIAAVEDAAALLTSLGHHVEPAASGVDERRLATDFLTMWF
ncbi:MAG: amidase, partial [Pseudonocardiales bacterium]|nr:amidase [Pseudonocardiales bacterium]